MYFSVSTLQQSSDWVFLVKKVHREPKGTPSIIVTSRTSIDICTGIDQELR
jgi:hypothetical protein